MTSIKPLFVATAALFLAVSAGADLPAPPPLPPLPPLPSVDVRIVAEAPPPPRHEVIVKSSRPGKGYVWLPGFWDWNESSWVWIDGRWDRPPQKKVFWVKAHYVRRHGEWEYVPGHWSHQKVKHHDHGRHRGWKK